jgi:hypothetical protein
MGCRALAVALQNVDNEAVASVNHDAMAQIPADISPSVSSPGIF